MIIITQSNMIQYCPGMHDACSHHHAPSHAVYRVSYSLYFINHNKNTDRTVHDNTVSPTQHLLHLTLLTLNYILNLVVSPHQPQLLTQILPGPDGLKACLPHDAAQRPGTHARLWVDQCVKIRVAKE